MRIASKCLIFLALFGQCIANNSCKDCSGTSENYYIERIRLEKDEREHSFSFEEIGYDFGRCPGCGRWCDPD